MEEQSKAMLAHIKNIDILVIAILTLSIFLLIACANRSVTHDGYKQQRLRDYNSICSKRIDDTLKIEIYLNNKNQYWAVGILKFETESRDTILSNFQHHDKLINRIGVVSNIVIDSIINTLWINEVDNMQEVSIVTYASKNMEYCAIIIEEKTDVLSFKNTNILRAWFYKPLTNCFHTLNAREIIRINEGLYIKSLQHTNE
jgi:uncharacterized membrane protein